MLKPIGVKLDLEAGAGYVEYRRLRTGEHVAKTDRLSDAVRVDYDDHGDILGIELLSLSHAAIETARSFAIGRELGFASHLAGAFVA